MATPVVGRFRGYYSRILRRIWSPFGARLEPKTSRSSRKRCSGCGTNTEIGTVPYTVSGLNRAPYRPKRDIQGALLRIGTFRGALLRKRRFRSSNLLFIIINNIALEFVTAEWDCWWNSNNNALPILISCLLVAYISSCSRAVLISLKVNLLDTVD